MLGGVGLVVSDHGEQDVGLAAGQADEGGVVFLALGSLAVVVGPTCGVGASEVQAAKKRSFLSRLLPPRLTCSPRMLVPERLVARCGSRRERSTVGRQSDMGSNGW